MNKPYPGYSPNYRQVKTTGSLNRTCLVVDILSLDVLSDAQIAVLQEQLSAQLNTICKKMQNIEKTEIIVPSRFDRLLKEGLRL